MTTRDWRTRALAAAGWAMGFTLCSVAPARAQGCVASRMDAPNSGLRHDGAETGELESYNLPKGKWQAEFGYRWYRSHRHFVGSVEQDAENFANGTAKSDRAGTEVINHIHLPSFGVTYGVTDRLSVSADLPYLIAARRSPVSGTRPSFETHSSGISDLNVMARYWLGNPATHGSQNLSIGLGIKAPTGNDDAQDDFLTGLAADGSQILQRRPVDQSIQPGDGGWGFLAEVQAFKSLGRVTAFASGSYLSNPREQNSFLRSGPTTSLSDPSNIYLSVADQFAARLGVGMPVTKRISVSLASRLEGVPSSDLIGGDMGFRRPGYSIGIEPGVSYSFHKSIVSLSVPYLVHRDRTQNISDKLATARTGTFVNGDAAFADYVVILGISSRF